MSRTLNQVILIVTALASAALLIQCVGLSRTVQAAPADAAAAAKSSQVVEGLQVENDGETVRYTVVDPDRSYLIFGSPVGPDRTYKEVEGEELPLVEVVVSGQTVKVRADRVSRAYELKAQVDCPAGPCLPCVFTNCTEPMPPPRGPDEPDWVDGFLLGGHLVEPGSQPVTVPEGAVHEGGMNADDWDGFDDAPRNR